ncbi:hypothetical protein ACFL03_02635 [Thermodesulfobacteriota bacterium]
MRFNAIREVVMPQQARLDAPGTLHHIICRGIERGQIFQDNADRDNFINRLSSILKQTSTSCYTWALIPNHFYLLLRTCKEPKRVMTRNVLSYWAVRELGISGAAVGGMLGLSQSAVSRAVQRGECLVSERYLSMEG